MSLIDRHPMRKRKQVEHEYLTSSEKEVFDRLYKNGEITIFRLKTCDFNGCDNPTPTAKKFCSKVCFMKQVGEDARAKFAASRALNDERDNDNECEDDDD